MTRPHPFRLLCALLGALALVVAAGAADLDFDFFKNEVQPIFLVKRPGHIACATCHAGGANSVFRLQPLKPGELYWDDEQSQANFAMVRAFVVPGVDPMQSRLLRHPLPPAVGGDPFHGGGRHWISQDDPEWQILKAWIAGARERAPGRRSVVRILQTNSAGDDTHLIDPATNRVVGVINDVPIPHGVAVSPDGRRIFLSDEALHSLDVVDARTLTVVRRIRLSGRPNNVAVGRDGRFVYVGIREMPGSVDIVDTAALSLSRTVKVSGAIHNIYVTPDGKHAVAGSIETGVINVIDCATAEVAWTLKLDAGIRPMAFDTRSDGSTRNIYVQLSNFHGFAVVDFKTRKEIARIEHPAVPGVAPHTDGLQGAPAHGLAVSPDGKRLWSTSKVYGYAFVHSLPDLQEVGRVFVGQHPEWLTFTPDGNYAYVAAAGDNQTFVIDANTLKEVARIPVGQVPKRNTTAILSLD